MRFTLALTVTLLSAAVLHADEPDRREFFEAKIRPVLVEHCYSCHSADSKSLKGGLRLDFRDGLIKGGDSGPALIAGKPNESMLISALRFDGLEMPPQGKLSEKVVRDFEHWIQSGAFDPRETPASVVENKPSIDYTAGAKFWAFQPIRDASPPNLPGDFTSDLDRFVEARLHGAGLRPNPRAEPHALLRRAYLDLIGIGPTPDEVHSFAKDPSPEAFTRVVDRLLESPQYGERWGRRWLDVARYGEDQAHTFKARKYPRAYLYRDWVVDALNQDMPYDQFLRWQIAGDLLEQPQRHQRLAALGLFALGPVYYAENVEKAKAAADEWDDRIDTLTRGVLGLTVSCARCHDHKFDPISMDDYYGLAGIFASSSYQERPAVSDEIVAKRQAADAEVQRQQQVVDKFLVAEAREVRPGLIKDIPDYFVAAWKLAQRKKTGGDKKKALKEVAKKAGLSQTLLQRWSVFLSPKTSRAEAEDALLADWLQWLASDTDLKTDLSNRDSMLAQAREFGVAFQQHVRVKLPQAEQLFSVFGDNVAFIAEADRAVVRSGVYPLGNLFDDSANVSLQAAIQSDKFSAVASADRLGVERLAQGWGDTTHVAPDLRFDFRKLGSSSHSYGSIVNDGWQAGGAIRTLGANYQSSQRAEQGIGMHANALITFDLGEIRKAGGMAPDQRFRFRVDRAGINDDTRGSSGSAYLAVLVTRPHRDKNVTDAVLASYINGRAADVDVDDFTYYFSGDVGKPLLADGSFVSFDIEISGDAKHLTLVTTGANQPADNPISSDHTVFSGARLELDPLPEEKSPTSSASETTIVASDKQARDDAIILSRLLYDEGLLALPAKEAESHFDAAQRAEFQTVRKSLEAVQAAANKISILNAHALVEGASTDLPIYIQGNPAKKGNVAPRGMPAIFTGGKKHPFDIDGGSGRLQLAEAIASADNPLTARVLVNRVWAGHFGAGLVKTTSNFGELGDRPSHPQLLDWLATRFIESGWSIKQLHRDIMLSDTYQRSSAANPEALTADPENRWLWRMSRRRLEVEPWRDNLLSVTGELDTSLGGPSMDLNDSNNRRRTIYGFVSRHRLNELLRLFDFPDPNITAADRPVTTVPLQQLFVLNSDFMTRRAKALAARIESMNLDPKAAVGHAYELVYNRPADAEELELATAFIASSDEGKSDKLNRWEQFALALLTSNEFLYVD